MGPLPNGRNLWAYKQGVGPNYLLIGMIIQVVGMLKFYVYPERPGRDLHRCLMSNEIITQRVSWLLVGVFLGDETLPSYVGILNKPLYGSLLNYKSFMESKALFFRGWNVFFFPLNPSIQRRWRRLHALDRVMMERSQTAGGFEKRTSLFLLFGATNIHPTVVRSYVCGYIFWYTNWCCSTKKTIAKSSPKVIFLASIGLFGHAFQLRLFRIEQERQKCSGLSNRWLLTWKCWVLRLLGVWREGCLSYFES